jgi:undecaprenyl-diphosphatase
VSSTRAGLLEHPRVAGVDAAVARAAASARGTAADRAVYLLSQAANHSMLWHGINLVDAVLGGPEHRRRALRRSVIVALEQAVVNGPVKSLVARQRPDGHDEHPHRLRTPRTSSFPSGHASAAACSATLLTRDLGAGPLWWALALGVGWTRVHVGVHHASDVAAGLALGRTLAAAAGLVWPAERRDRHRAG